MANYNKIILVGNLTRDPQTSYLPSQMPVAEFGLAVNRRWRGQDGQQREETCFIDCRAYGKQAETIAQYLQKGKSVLVEGRLQYDTWEGKDGVKRSKHRVVVEGFQFLGAPGAPRPGGAAPAAHAQQAAPDSGEMSEPAPPMEEGGGDGIPF
ncbi:MAG: single-stranded DNA-binding protein [Phycisphaerae bacterium]|jgi:single-strand DNA-binding protein